MAKILLLALVFNLLWSCGRSECPEYQTNEILSQYSVNSREYQNELARLISSETGRVNYYFEERTVQNDTNYLLVNCQGRNFCGVLKVLVHAEDNFSAKLQNNKGWHGAFLKGFALEVAEHQDNLVATYLGMRRIVD